MLYVFSWFWGVSGREIPVSPSSQGCIRGDPSPGLASVVVTCTPPLPSPLFASGAGAWWPMSPGFLCGELGVGGENPAAPSGHLSD